MWVPASQPSVESKIIMQSHHHTSSHRLACSLQFSFPSPSSFLGQSFLLTNPPQCFLPLFKPSNIAIRRFFRSSNIAIRRCTTQTINLYESNPPCSGTGAAHPEAP